MTTVVLLGAGASADAGLPTTAEMTREILRRFEDERRGWGGVTPALNFVVAAMSFHDAATTGSSPVESVDVERVISAVEMLAERDELEVAPFVQSWHPAVSSVGAPRPNFPAFFGGDFLSAIEAKSERSVETLLRTAILSQSAATNTDVYSNLLRELVRALVDVLRIEDPERTRYLAPLFDLASAQGGLAVATLNYDLSVETCGELLSHPVRTHIEEWIGKGHIAAAFPPSGVHLFKLHGSINWVAKRGQNQQGTMPEPRIEPTDNLDFHDMPAVIFGQRGKLRTDGPYLDLLASFIDALHDAEHLLVIGYSFRDDHVNEVLRKWINVDPARTITVIDPTYPQFPGGAYPPRFRDELLLHLTSRAKPERFPARLHVVRERTEDALPGVVEALAERASG